MFKRRPLNKNKTDAPAAVGTSTPTLPAATPPGPTSPRPERTPNQNRNPRQNRHGGRGQNQNQNLNQNPSSQAPSAGSQQGLPSSHGPGLRSPGQQRPRPQGPRPPGSRPQGQNQRPQGQQGQQGQNSNSRRNRNRRPQNRPQPPPAYLQRDILLMLTPESSKTIEEVRNRFDPLSKKVPAHITVLFPEPAAKITNDFIKTSNVTELPSLRSLTFQSIQIIDDMYLWLVPNDESADKLKSWHEEFRKRLPENTQDEKFQPHLTLGYIPRKVPEEEALAFAKNLIPTPLTLSFESLLLEEFGEDQQSRSLDRFQILL